MPRPPKCRRVCNFPQTLEFFPEQSEGKDRITLSVDEYETIRLIDKEGLSQEACSEYMQIARTTVQQIYANARKKLADMLVDGRPLRIEGGDYVICNGTPCHNGCASCLKPQIIQTYARAKGEGIMRIAVTYENGQIFQHFGHTEQFKLYDIAGGKITGSEVVDTNGSGHGALAGFLMQHGVDTRICGGIGGGAQTALAASGIRLYGGCSGDADEAVSRLLDGTLGYDPNVHCNHHDQAHGDDAHSCSHAEGSHSCGHH